MSLIRTITFPVFSFLISFGTLLRQYSNSDSIKPNPNKVIRFLYKTSDELNSSASTIQGTCLSDL